MKATFDFEGVDARPTRTLSTKEEENSNIRECLGQFLFLKALEKNQMLCKATRDI